MSNPSIPNLQQPRLRGEGLPVSQVSSPRLGLVLGAGQHMRTANGERRYDLSVLDLDAPGNPLTLIPLSFFGHGFAPHPLRPELISIFEKRGRGACELDLKAGAVTRPIETEPGREFYGHGTYSADGALLYAAETVLGGDYEGLIAVRDAESHEILGEFPTYGSSPHDCRLVDGGSTMVITNGGGPMAGVPPSVTYVDMRTQQLLEKLEFDTPTINAGHVDVAQAGALAVVSAQREGLPDQHPGGITFRFADGTFRTLREPRKVVQRLLGETLSVCIHEGTGIVGATTPAGNLLTFWELATGRLVRYYVIENPRGITLTQDQSHFIVSFGFGTPPEAICLVSASTLRMAEHHRLAPTGITGSHLLSYSFPPPLRSQ